MANWLFQHWDSLFVKMIHPFHNWSSHLEKWILEVELLICKVDFFPSQPKFLFRHLEFSKLKFLFVKKQIRFHKWLSSNWCSHLQKWILEVEILICKVAFISKNGFHQIENPSCKSELVKSKFLFVEVFFSILKSETCKFQKSKITVKLVTNTK